MDIVFFLYDGMTALDFVGPHEVLSRLPNARVMRAATHAGRIETDSGVVLEADHSLDAITSADVLVVPGAASIESALVPSSLHWIRAIDKTTTWTTSVCTGALILGAAGLLNGRRATTHWGALDELKRFGAVAERERIVEDGKIVTSAGVSAGIDFAIMLADRIAGSAEAQAIQLTIEYDPQPPFNAGDPRYVDDAIVSKALRGLGEVIAKRAAARSGT